MKLQSGFILFASTAILFVEAPGSRSRTSSTSSCETPADYYDHSLFEEVARKAAAPSTLRSMTRSIPEWNSTFGSNIDDGDVAFFTEITKVLRDADLVGSVIVADFAAGKFVRIVPTDSDFPNDTLFPESICAKVTNAITGLDTNVIVYWDVTAKSQMRRGDPSLVVDQLKLVVNDGVGSLLYPKNIIFAGRFCLLDLEKCEKVASAEVPIIDGVRLELIKVAQRPRQRYSRGWFF